MNNVHSMLPVLIMNRLLIQDLMDVDAPCFALGKVQLNNETTGFIAVRPPEAIPDESTLKGFDFGHSVIGIEDSPVLHFAFNFHGHMTYHGLVNPGNTIVQNVLSSMIETGHYLFFSINPDQTATSFGAMLPDKDAFGLKSNLERFKKVSCMPSQYEKTVEVFGRNPLPPGEMLNWVCRDNPDYLDLDRYPMEVNPRV